MSQFISSCMFSHITKANAFFSINSEFYVLLSIPLPPFSCMLDICNFSIQKKKKMVLTTLEMLTAASTFLVLVWAPFSRFFLHELQSYVTMLFINKITIFISPCVTIAFHEYSSTDTFTRSQYYENIQNYVSVNSVGRLARKLKAVDVKDSRTMFLGLDDIAEVHDEFQGVKVKWNSDKTVSVASSRGTYSNSNEKRHYTLSFHKRHYQLITTFYIDHVMKEGKEIALKNRKRKLYTNSSSQFGRGWTSVDFEHPASFDTLALDPEKKKEIIKDLLKFRNGKRYYKKIGKPWKRGYLLYGPPGTGKSTLIAAMAKYLDYDPKNFFYIYDLELTAVSNNNELKKLLTAISSKSIIVVEDIDCSHHLTGQRKKKKEDGEQSADSVPETFNSENESSKVTLSGLLNFTDGLSSACGDERIFVFSTNYFDKLDPALIRKGRMDKHIELSYCGFEAFKLLAKIYLDVESHDDLFPTIERLLGETDMTPADVTENLIAYSEDEDADKCLKNLVEALEKAKEEAEEEAKLEKESAGISGTKGVAKYSGALVIKEANGSVTPTAEGSLGKNKAVCMPF
ncbi:AAA-ATPase ASD, mitochondrial-like [Humulus lupulus]|uniref:AAA-ATPase ASD, mitochondrial-like n=1 Tax=Humulus lupulus TaxID=3486 RepID=UPI002B40E65D|nr:AAA-ATPase ASD, mitochondrial-like [Humulus lupulus]